MPPIHWLSRHRPTILLALLFVVAIAQPAAAATIGLNFTGTSRSYSGVLVPDVAGAVGPNHIVETLNYSIAVYEKSTGTLLARGRPDSFWNAALARGGGGSVGFQSSYAPRVVYDPTSSRWFVTYDDGGGDQSGRILLGVSDTDNPLAETSDGLIGWKGYQIDGDPSAQPDRRWSDFPTLGVDRDSLTISTNLLDIANHGVIEPRGIAVYSIPKSDLLQSMPTLANRSEFTFAKPAALGNSSTALHGVINFGPADGRAALFAANPRFGLQRWDLTGTAESRAGAATLSSPINIPIGPFQAPLAAEQPGDVQSLYNGGGPFTGIDGTIVDDLARLGASLVQQDNHAWGVYAAKAGERSGVRWFEVDLTTSAIVQSGTISDPALDLIHPSIAVNQFGDAVIGFTASGETLYPSAYAVVGDTKGGVTTFGSLLELKRGVSTYLARDSQGRNRWGNYSTTVVDPSNPLHFWTFQEFASGNNGWGVQITQIIIPEPGALTLTACGILVVGFVTGWRRRCVQQCRLMTLAGVTAATRGRRLATARGLQSADERQERVTVENRQSPRGRRSHSTMPGQSFAGSSPPGPGRCQAVAAARAREHHRRAQWPRREKRLAQDEPVEPLAEQGFHWRVVGHWPELLCRAQPVCGAQSVCRAQPDPQPSRRLLQVPFAGE